MRESRQRPRKCRAGYLGQQWVSSWRNRKKSKRKRSPVNAETNVRGWWNGAMACAASPVGGEDRPADVAVSGHGRQLPPEGNNREDTCHKVPSCSTRDAFRTSASTCCILRRLVYARLHALDWCWCESNVETKGWSNIWRKRVKSKKIKQT